MPQQYDSAIDVHRLAARLPVAEERYWFGDLTLAARPSAAVLNSRQGRLWRGEEPWVRATVRAAAALIDDEKVLLTATGLPSWELAAWAAAEALGNVILLTPLPAGMIVEDAHLRLATLLDDLGLHRANALCIPWFVPPRESEKTLWKARDAVILRNADRLLPVAIRPGGFLDACLADPRVADKADDRFHVEYAPSRLSIPDPPDPGAARRALADFTWDHTAHWTRAAHRPWPGESRSDYYHALVHQRGGHPRSARATLARILQEQRLRGSGLHMPMGQAMVSLSALHPAEMLPRMRWRKRYVRVEYEPWGVAVRRDALLRLHGREVTYGDMEARKQLAAADRLYFQRISDRADWEHEQEWRVRGDLDLSALADDEAVVFVPTPDEVDEFQTISRFPVRPLT